MNLLSVISQIKEAVSPLPLFFEGEVIDSEESAVGCLYLSGETIVNKCYNPNGYLFHKTIKRFQGLPTFRGIQMQKKDLYAWIKQKQKNFGTKWNIPQYL